MKRQTPVTLKVNRRFKTKRERPTHLEFICKALHEYDELLKMAKAT